MYQVCVAQALSTRSGRYCLVWFLTFRWTVHSESGRLEHLPQSLQWRELPLVTALDRACSHTLNCKSDRPVGQHKHSRDVQANHTTATSNPLYSTRGIIVEEMVNML